MGRANVATGVTRAGTGVMGAAARTFARRVAKIGTKKKARNNAQSNLAAFNIRPN